MENLLLANVGLVLHVLSQYVSGDRGQPHTFGKHAKLRAFLGIPGVSWDVNCYPLENYPGSQKSIFFNMLPSMTVVFSTSRLVYKFNQDES